MQECTQHKYLLSYSLGTEIYAPLWRGYPKPTLATLWHRTTLTEGVWERTCSFADCTDGPLGLGALCRSPLVTAKKGAQTRTGLLQHLESKRLVEFLLLLGFRLFIVCVCFPYASTRAHNPLTLTTSGRTATSDVTLTSRRLSFYGSTSPWTQWRPYRRLLMLCRQETRVTNRAEVWGAPRPPTPIPFSIRIFFSFNVSKQNSNKSAEWKHSSSRKDGLKVGYVNLIIIIINRNVFIL